MYENKMVLYTDNLTKKFGGLIAVKNVSIHVNENEIVGLIGANGAGKTTLFNMIAGTFAPTSGIISFMGSKIQGKAAHKICQLGISRTHQIVKPFQNLTVLENATVGALLRDENVKNATKYAREICKFVGLENRMNVSGGSLGLPELKRMEIARALCTKPKLLLLDEAMAGLNPVESEREVELIRKINQTGITIIVIEHIMKAIMSLSDRIYVMNQGDLIAEGTPLEVSNNPEVIKSYLGEKRYAKN